MANNNGVKQSKNIVKIIGILVENSLKQGTYKNAEQKDVEYISGALNIRVNQMISGREEVNEIPVNVWVSKYTKNGALNPAYESMRKAMETYVSLAVCDDESKATKVLITTGSLTENIFSADGQNVFCSPRIQASFINSITNIANYIPEATFTTDMVVGNITDEIDKEGVATGRLKVKGMVCRYNGTMDTFDYVVEHPDAINYIRSYWKIGDTVQVSGKIRFTVKTEQIEVPTRFGDPVFKTKTTNCRELVITADSSDVLTEADKYSEEEVTNGLAKRAELIEKAKENAKKSSSGTTTPATKSNPYGF